MNTATKADRARAEAISDHARWLGAAPDVAAAAADRVVSDPNLILLGLTGWMCSGKDVVAPAVLDALQAHEPVHLFYARALKDELTDILTAASEVADELTARPDVDARRTAELAERFTMDTGAMAELLRRVHDDPVGMAGGETRTGYSRTPGIRLGLQWLGTNVRREQDPFYWVKRTLAPLVPALAEGRSLFATDIRFPNEVEGAQGLGFKVVRLDISRETQRQRLLERDGLVPDPEALIHPSETALDDYDGFDLRFDNEGTVDDAVAQIVRLWDTSHGR